MGNCLPHGLGGRGHWLDMLGGRNSEVKQRACDRFVLRLVKDKANRPTTPQLAQLSRLRCEVERAATSEEFRSLSDHRIHN